MSNHNKAPLESLENLHAAVAENLLMKIRSGEATAADLQAAIKFLKDNGIDAIPVEGSGLGELKKALPFRDDEEPAAGE